MVKLAVFVMAVDIAATTALSALPASPRLPMRTMIVKEVCGTPPASFSGEKITPGGSRTVDGSGSTVGHRTTHVTENMKFEYMRPVNAAGDCASPRALAENTEAMRRWSSEGGLPARRSRPLARLREKRGPAKERFKIGAAALMREANEIGSGSEACAKQGRGLRRRSDSFRNCSSLGFGLLEGNRRAVQHFAPGLPSRSAAKNLAPVLPFSPDCPAGCLCSSLFFCISTCRNAFAGNLIREADSPIAYPARGGLRATAAAVEVISVA